MARPLSDDWREWLELNLGRGCDVDELFRRAQRQDFDPDAISKVLGGYKPADSARTTPEPGNDDVPAAALYQALFDAPMTRRDNVPRAWKLDTDLAQVYEVPNLLSDDECRDMMEVIDKSLRRSTTTRGPADYRTSRTCDMRRADPAAIEDIDKRLAALTGRGPEFSEPIQGQRYDPGEYFKAHTDWFAPNTDEFTVHTKTGGQRTWTIMVYLNTVEAGGETVFERVGRAFQPITGTAIAWNNLNADGTPNHNVLHEAMPVITGRKYVITKWFRENAGLNV